MCVYQLSISLLTVPNTDRSSQTSGDIQFSSGISKIFREKIEL